MLQDDKRPGDGPKEGPKDGPDEEPEEKTEAQADEGDADAGLNRAERRRRKHGRKGELRQLHDRSIKKDSKGHGGRVFRRKSF